VLVRITIKEVGREGGKGKRRKEEKHNYILCRGIIMGLRLYFLISFRGYSLNSKKAISANFVLQARLKVTTKDQESLQNFAGRLRFCNFKIMSEELFLRRKNIVV
jgi:hypothetical protein